MADLGAEVIKIEEPQGDAARRRGPFPGGVPHPEKSGLYLALNTNKRSVTVNLDTSFGQQVVRRLASASDILVETFPAGYLQDRELGQGQHPGPVEHSEGISTGPDMVGDSLLSA